MGKSWGVHRETLRMTALVEGTRLDRRGLAKAVVGAAVGAALVISATGAGGYHHRYDQPDISVSDPRVVVLKSKRLLHLFDGAELIRTYPIDLGIVPAGQKQVLGDGRTPVGTFRIVTKNPDSSYHRFLGIDYPDARAAESGLFYGLISPGEAASIRQAAQSGRRPEWGTALGGGIGLHGHRIGRDWTGGCIALSDDGVEELFAVLRIGDPVEILP